MDFTNVDIYFDSTLRRISRKVMQGPRKDDKWVFLECSFLSVSLPEIPVAA